MEQRQISMQDLDELPPHLQIDPHMIHWRIRRVEHRVERLEKHHSSINVKTPMGELPLPIVLLLGLGLLAYRPDLAIKLLGL